MCNVWMVARREQEEQKLERRCSYGWNQLWPPRHPQCTLTLTQQLNITYCICMDFHMIARYFLPQGGLSAFWIVHFWLCIDLYRMFFMTSLIFTLLLYITVFVLFIFYVYHIFLRTWLLIHNNNKTMFALSGRIFVT